MKPGDKVYMATVNGVEEYYFISFDDAKANLSCDFQARSRPFWCRACFVFATREGAIKCRIYLLEKSIRTMETTTTNHLRTIRELHEELKSPLSTTSEVSNGQDQEEKVSGPPVRNEADSA